MLRHSALKGLCGAVDTAAADTWATELGSRSRQSPRSLATLQPVPAGTSGGVTLAGLAASAAGAAIASAPLLLPRAQPADAARRQVAAAALGGLAGSLTDSLIGATVQEARLCDVCGETTERLAHHGAATRRIRGLPGLNNDVVNGLATAAGAATAIAFHAILRERGRSGRRVSSGSNGRLARLRV